MTGAGDNPWDDEADRFDEAADHGLADPDVRRAWRGLLTGCLPSPPASVADIGCGTGSLSVLLAEQGYSVRGIDRSERMLERARAKASGMARPPTFEIGDAERPPLERASFDIVLSRHVVWALDDPAAALGRWIELLAANGRLVLIEGRWDTGAGLAASDLEALIRPIGRVVALDRLTDPGLWGREISDERYLMVAERAP